MPKYLKVVVLVDPNDFIGTGWSGVWSEAWVEQAEVVITAMGLELVDVEREQDGLLRISLDSPNGINVNDCETVSRQLSHLFTVENVFYERLEVSSPGVDRVLRRRQDLNRFIGSEVSIKFKKAVENTKNFKGILQLGASHEYCLHLHTPLNSSGDQQLNFDLTEIAAARLVPHLKF